MTGFFFPSLFKKRKNAVVKSRVSFSRFHAVAESQSPDTSAIAEAGAHVLEIIWALLLGGAHVPRSVL